jgi:hypothetical protein
VVDGAKNDLVEDQSPLRAPLGAIVQGLPEPFLLDRSGDRSGRVEVDSQVRNVVGVDIDVCHVAIVLPGVKGNDIKQVSKLKIPPNPLFVVDIDLANRDPLMVRSLGIGGPFGKAHTRLSAERTTGGVRVVRVGAPSLPGVVSDLVVVPDIDPGEKAVVLAEVGIGVVLSVSLAVVMEGNDFLPPRGFTADVLAPGTVLVAVGRRELNFRP